MQVLTPSAWVYADIVKVEDEPDGSVRVYGRPTHDVLDVDHQVADKEWVRKAVPEWFRTGANIREMHQPKAIGKGEKLEFDEQDDPWLTARIVEPTAVKLVKEGVLQGFSIGIKDPVIKRDPHAPNGRIVDGKIVEVSAVDRPAVPTAKFELVKMTTGGEWWDVQSGFVLTKTNATDGTQLNPADFDAEGNPIHQPGHLQPPGDAPESPEPEIISQDTHTVTVRVGSKVYQVPIDMDGQGHVVVGMPEEVPGILPAEGTPMGSEAALPTSSMKTAQEDAMEKAVWSTAYVDTLPDSAFAYISPGGHKDAEGKTVPRSLRHLPYKDKDGHIDAAHVRNALARLDQTDIPAAAKAEARRKLEAAAKEVGIDVNTEDKSAQLAHEDAEDREEARHAERMKDLQEEAEARLKAEAEKAALARKVLCQTCRKSVAMTKVMEVTKLAGGARVIGVADCGHPVAAFVKAAEPDAYCEHCKKAVAVKEHKDGHAGCIGDCDHEVKCVLGKGAAPDPERRDDANPRGVDPAKPPAKPQDKTDPDREGGDDEDPETERMDAFLEKKFAALEQRLLALLGKASEPSDAAHAEETRKRRLRDLRELHAKLGKKIDEYAESLEAKPEDHLHGDAEEVGKSARYPAGGPARPRFDDPQEVIKELRGHLREMMRLVEDGDDEMGHIGPLGEKDGHLITSADPNDGIPPERKPRGDGRLNLTAGDGKAISVDLIKAAVAQAVAAQTETTKAVVPDLGKAVGEAVKSVLEPVLNRLEKVEHLAQPSPFLIAAEKAYALNPQEEQRTSAVKSVQAEMQKLSPKDRERVLAAAIAKDRGWA